jgi:hypothetical protein
VKTICEPTLEKNRTSPNNRRHVGRMWSVHLICSNLDGLLFDILLGHGAQRWCGRWWLLVWSCTTWSSRMSAMKASMTKGGNFRVSWLPRIQGQIHWGVPPCAPKGSWLHYSAEGYDWTSVDIGMNGRRHRVFFISSCFHMFPFELCY